MSRKNATQECFKNLGLEMKKGIQVIGSDIKILCINLHKVFTDPKYWEPKFSGTLVARLEKPNGELVLLLRDEKLVLHLNFTNCLKRLIEVPELNINIPLSENIIYEIKNLSTTDAEPSEALNSIIKSAWQQANDDKTDFEEWYDAIEQTITCKKSFVA